MCEQLHGTRPPTPVPGVLLNRGKEGAVGSREARQHEAECQQPGAHVRTVGFSWCESSEKAEPQGEEVGPRPPAAGLAGAGCEGPVFWEVEASRASVVGVTQRPAPVSARDGTEDGERRGGRIAWGEGCRVSS